MESGNEYENGVLFASPSTPLPQEMMTKIFLRCVESEELSSSLPSSTSAPFNLTWVCRYWRRLAISMPSLWTSIALGENGTDPANDVRLLNLWIERAGPTKRMNIMLCYEMKDAERPVFFDPNRGERYLVGMKVLTDKLLSISQRWQTLELHALDLYVLDPILRALATNGAPHLEALSISTKYFDFFGSVHFIDLSNCPTLCNLRLLCPMLCPTINSVPAVNMTNLEIRFCPLMRDCHTWLSICPNLKRLNVRFFRAISSSLPREKGPITLPRLTHLTISCFSDDSDPSPLLGLLHLPSLRALSLDMNGFVHPELNQAWSERMCGIIKRCASSLEHLSVLGTPMTSEALIQLLESTRRLKRLVLSGLVVSDRLLDSLAINMNSRGVESAAEETRAGNEMTFSLCPRLESLELREFDCSLNTLVSLAYARCRLAFRSPRSSLGHEESSASGNSGTLKSLTLIWNPHSTLLDHPLIRECIAGGLEVVNRAYNTAKFL
ncbi:hypothetical protein ACEPAF_449 [Sanghuangporus sanghuang]